MVPWPGTYTSDDGVQQITIISANPENGQITFSYACSSSPVGPLSISKAKGGYAWVRNGKVERDGVAPFTIAFSVMQRPDDRAYCIKDAWNGAYQKDDTLLLSGTRAYVNREGVVQSISLGTKVFSTRGPPVVAVAVSLA